MYMVRVVVRSLFGFVPFPTSTTVPYCVSSLLRVDFVCTTIHCGHLPSLVVRCVSQKVSSRELVIRVVANQSAYCT